MTFVRRLIIALILIAFVATAILVAGSLTSYDWKRKHANASLDLPAVAEARDGLVRIAAGPMEFRARAVNLDGSGEPVLLLHGFPETSAMWGPLLAALGAAGHPAVAFDQRGYSPLARPDTVAQYQVRYLVADVLAVADALGWQRFHLIGHDWGAAVGWLATITAADRVISWTALSIPHPAAFAAALATSPDQQRRSRYFLLFRTPWLPELLFSFNHFKLLNALYEPMTAAQKAEPLEVLAEPGALTAALDWYRANRLDAAPGVSMDVAQPVLFVWGTHDPAVSRDAVAGQRPYLKGTFETLELDAGHWLMEEAADRVVPRVLAHVETAEQALHALDALPAPVEESGAPSSDGNAPPAPTLTTTGVSA